MTLRFATFAFSLAILAAGCGKITPTKTVDLCEGDTWSRNCAACRANVPDARCEQCKGASPAAACKGASGGGSGGNASGGSSGNGDGGKGGTSGSSGAGAGGDGGGGAGTGGSGSSMDAGKDAGPCGHTCPSDKPACVDGTCEQCAGDTDCADPMKSRCEPTTHTCVQCLAKTDCTGDTPQCDTSATGMHTCVQCLQSTDCTDAAKPVCADDVCVACTVDADCSDPTKPECKEHVCGACTGDAACSERAATPHCDTASSSASKGQCVQCLADGDCSDLAKAQCNASRQCVACTSDTACTGRSGTEVCDTDAAAPMHGQCVQCTPAKRAACSSSANACKRSDDTCTSTGYQSLLPCLPCVTDGECVIGARCVVHDFDSTHHLGPYCFYDRVLTGACADGTHAAYRPYSNPASATSVDGASSTYCLPPTTTTCKGIADATDWNGQGGGAKSCTPSAGDQCGEENLSDAVCGDGTNGSPTNKCTYGCGGPTDCPQSGFSNCPTSGTPKNCQP